MKANGKGRMGLWCAAALGASAFGCASGHEPHTAVTQQQLERRAYVVSRESDELTVIDLDTLSVVGRVATGGVANHMAELSADLRKVYVSSAKQDRVIVVDAEKLEVVKSIPVGHESTHLSVSRDGRLLAVMDEAEGDGAVSFIDTVRDVEIKRLPGFYTPHFLRFAPDQRYGYVANLNAYHITRVDLDSLEIDAEIGLDGLHGPVNDSGGYGEGGFADAQIDANGILYAAHAATGRVLVYDTEQQRKLPELKVGARPWIVYADHPFHEVDARVVPSFGDQHVSVIRGETPQVSGDVEAADQESFGVNYSSMVPERAFVMNRIRQEIAVVDTKQMQVVSSIPLDGNTETAATTPDGKLIVASVSSSNQIAVIDPASSSIIKTFDGIGRYPWSVTVPLGQNYCH